MRRPPLLLLGLALIWGSSFMFIKVADRQLAPATLILGRIGSGALVLLAVSLLSLGPRQTWAELHGAWRWLTIVALVNTALPFWLLSWGETRLDSGLASVIQAAVPLFSVLFAFAAFHEARVVGLRLVGIALGFVGVALLVGAQPHGQLLGALAVVGMAVCYAVGQLLAGRHLKGTPPLIVALGSTAIATLATLPAGLWQAPSALPSAETWLAVLTLGVVGTALAYLIFFALIQSAGPAYASLVTYLIPPLALLYGAAFLGERFAWSAFGALALILVGVTLGGGGRPKRLRRLTWARRDEPEAAAACLDPAS